MSATLKGLSDEADAGEFVDQFTDGLSGIKVARGLLLSPRHRPSYRLAICAARLVWSPRSFALFLIEPEGDFILRFRTQVLRERWD
jgi:hypothetical protein